MDVYSIVKKLGIDKYSITASGTEIKACCPFHKEKHPSFYVEIKTGLYYCHACNAKGKVDEIEKTVDFDYMYELLNDKQIKKQDNTFVYKKMPLSKEAKEYLKSRNILDKAIEKFRIHETMEYRFSKRVIVPITDNHFIARTYINAMPKFLYSKGFQRSETVFECLHDKNEVFIVEGVFDAIYLWQNGLSATSVLGCNISNTQKNIITKYRKIILMFDGDNAGISGTKQALNLLRGYNIYYVLIKGDPDGITDFNNLPIKKYIGVWNYDIRL